MFEDNTKHERSAFRLCYNLYHEARLRSKKRTITKTQAKATSFSNTALEEVEDFVPSNFTVVESSIFQGLGSRSKAVVHQIIEQLKMGNALWHFDHTKNSRDATAIKELREKRILFKTENTVIHFVNPKYIRKGEELTVLILTLNKIKTASKVTTDHIVELRTSKTINIPPSDLL